MQNMQDVQNMQNMQYVIFFENVSSIFKWKSFAEVDFIKIETPLTILNHDILWTLCYLCSIVQVLYKASEVDSQLELKEKHYDKVNQ